MNTVFCSHNPSAYCEYLLIKSMVPIYRVERKAILRVMVWIRAFPLNKLFLLISHLIKVTLLSDSLPRPLLSCHSPFLYLHSSSLAALSTRLLIPITSQTQVTQLCLWKSSDSFLALYWDKNEEEINFKGKKLLFLPLNDYCKIQNGSWSLHNFFFDFSFYVLNHRSTSLKTMLQG